MYAFFRLNPGVRFRNCNLLSSTMSCAGLGAQALLLILQSSTNELLQWSYQRAQVFLAEMRKALKDYTVHAYLEV
jgi:hypothetical protein